MIKLIQIRMLLHEIYYVSTALITVVSTPILLILAIFLNLKKILLTKKKGKNIKNQVALITGSARGLGRLLAIELAKKGCHVAIVDIQQELGEETVKYINENYSVKVKFYKVDVTDYNQLEQLNKNVTEDLGPVTILINNAVMMYPSAIYEFTPQEIQQMININIVAMCYTHKIFLPKMKELNRGYIVNISSVAALYNSPLNDIYGGTKAAVRSITSALRIQLMNECKDIGVTTVMPSIMNTNQKVEDLVRKSGIQKLIPITEGASVAKYVMKAMLNNENEITAPFSFFYNHKLAEFFPISLREYFMAISTARSENNLLRK